MSTQIQIFKTLINSETPDSLKIINFIQSNSMHETFKKYEFNIDLFLNPENHSDKAFVQVINSIIDHVHAQACYGVRRVIPTRAQTS